LGKVNLVASKSIELSFKAKVTNSILDILKSPLFKGILFTLMILLVLLFILRKILRKVSRSINSRG
jgi:hypothetical protein